MRISRTLLLCGVVLYLLVYTAYFFLPELPFTSDSWFYYETAQKCINAGTLYPGSQNLQDDNMVAPVYINMLICVLNIWSNPKAIFILNGLLNLLQLALVYLICRKLFDTATATTASIFYLLYLNNLGLLLLNYTELSFGVFLLLSFYLYIKSEDRSWIFTSGFILGLAIGVRPTGWAFVISVGLMLLWNSIHHRFQIQKPLIASVGLGLYILTAGLISYHSTGDFVFMSTTGAANFIIGANDKADGTYHDEILFLPQYKQLQYKERNNAYRRDALHWIINHPAAWLKTFPQKIYSTLIADDFAVSQLLLDPNWTLNRYIKEWKLHNFPQTFDQKPLWYRIVFLCVNGFHQIIYFIILVSFLIRSFMLVKKRIWNEHIVLLYLFLCVGLAMTLVSTIGSLRYKYNFMIIILILASPWITERMQYIFSRIDPVLSRSKRTPTEKQ